MKKLLFLLLALTASAASASATAPATDSLPAESQGAAVYDLLYKVFGITAKVATATFTLEESEWEGHPAYLSTARIVMQPLFRFFLMPEYTAKAWYTHNTLSPLYFTHPFEDSKKKGTYEVVYDYDSQKVHSIWAVEGKETEETVVDLRDQVCLELLSTLNYLRFHDFSEDAPEKVVLLMPTVTSDAEISLQDDHILLRVLGEGVLEDGSGHNLLFWRSSGPDRRVLGFETDLGSGTLFCAPRQP